MPTSRIPIGSSIFTATAAYLNHALRGVFLLEERLLHKKAGNPRMPSPEQILAAIVLATIFFSGFFLLTHARAEAPVITSVGRTCVRIHGVKSNNALLPYTIPATLLEEDEEFSALMTEAEKYIGYPYVMDASNPDYGFDCSGFVCWVYMQSGVYDTGRRGANGLFDLCEVIEPEDAKPGDLVFFEHTMGSTPGITHVGIFVGNHMMIHAGDPVGFADLSTEKWRKRFY